MNRLRKYNKIMLSALLLVMVNSIVSMKPFAQTTVQTDEQKAQKIIEKVYTRFTEDIARVAKGSYTYTYPLQEAAKIFFRTNLGGDLNNYKFQGYTYYVFKKKFPSKTIKDYMQFLHIIKDKLPDFSDADYRTYENYLNVECTEGACPRREGAGTDYGLSNTGYWAKIKAAVKKLWYGKNLQ